MLSLKYASLFLVLCITECVDWNKLIKSVEYQTDYGDGWFDKDSNKMSLNSERRFFTDQRQDHFDTLNRNTWHQTYFVHRPTGQRSDVPIVFIGGEGDIPDLFDSTKDLLPNQGQSSMTFSLAHRYYQEGKHINPTEHFDATTDSRLLSSKQALADLAYFIEKVVLGEYKFTKLPLVFGCSYPGSLAVWFREKYPHLSIGAIALSAPIYAFDDFHQYLEVGEKAVKDLIPKCFPLLVNAKKSLENAVRDNCTAFAKNVNLCTDTGFKHWEDVLRVGWILASRAYAGGLGQWGDVNHAQGLCDRLQKDGPFKFLAFFLDTSTGKCRDPKRVVEQHTITPYADTWYWQKCSEFGWFKTHSKDNLFTLFSLEECHKACKQAYDIDVPLLEQSLAETNIFYGARNITGLTKLLVLNGADDPWSAPSMYEYGNDYDGLVSKIIPKGHHCTRVNGKFTKEAKQYVKQAIDTWLK